jgi:hypothetical protein
MIFAIGICAFFGALFVRESRAASFFVFVFPIFVLSALQFEVGTDYQSYFRRAAAVDGSTFSRKFEYFFSWMTEYSGALFGGQGVFFASSLVQFAGLGLLIRHGVRLFGVNARWFPIVSGFSVLFLGGVAANQLNLLRFFCAIPFLIIGIHLIQFEQRRVKGLIFILVSAQFHVSSILIALAVALMSLRSLPMWLWIIFGFVFLGLFEQFLLFLSHYYGPATRVAESFSVSMSNFPLTKMPALMVIIATFYGLHESLKKSALWPFIFFSVPTLLLLDPSISNRLWNFVNYTTFYFFGIALFQSCPKKREILIVLFLLMLVFTALKYFVFPEADYLYQSILFQE